MTQDILTAFPTTSVSGSHVKLGAILIKNCRVVLELFVVPVDGADDMAKKMGLIDSSLGRNLTNWPGTVYSSRVASSISSSITVDFPDGQAGRLDTMTASLHSSLSLVARWVAFWFSSRGGNVVDDDADRDKSRQ